MLTLPSAGAFRKLERGTGLMAGRGAGTDEASWNTNCRKWRWEL